ncbi:MAG: hypothetical protein KF729_38460, partial [Sandaracinaceae bacterium]|nr:hypothetical protein [Sandaracinaceae bacterium]
EDGRGRPAASLALLERAEALSLAHARPVAAAIARYQRGARLGGDEGAALCRDAEGVIAQAGLSPALLQEDPALR